VAGVELENTKAKHLDYLPHEEFYFLFHTLYNPVVK